MIGGKARAGGCSTNPSEVVQGVSVMAGPLFRCLAGWQLQAGPRAMDRLYKTYSHTIPHLMFGSYAQASEGSNGYPFKYRNSVHFPSSLQPLRAFWNSAQLVAAGYSLHKQLSHSLPIADLPLGGTDMRHPSRVVLPVADGGQ